MNKLREFVRTKISAIRIANGYSSRKLSVELGKSTEYLNQVENGRLNPSLEFLSDFCDFFGISLSNFFDTNNAYPTIFKEICSDLSVLNNEEVDQIANIVKSLAKNKTLK